MEVRDIANTFGFDIDSLESLLLLIKEGYEKRLKGYIVKYHLFSPIFQY